MIKMMTEVLVEVPKEYETTETRGNVTIHLDNEIDNVKNTVRYGTVVSVPIVFKLDIKIGDKIYFHHNVVREPDTLKEGREYTHGMYDFDRFKGLYRCPLDLIFAIERDRHIMALRPFCFIKPYVLNGEEIPNVGIIKYGNDNLTEQGYNEGDLIVYYKFADYIFNINGEKLYRMKDHRIEGKLE
jgi:co-chaperonin GroES (HSP10)